MHTFTLATCQEDNGLSHRVIAALAGPRGYSMLVLKPDANACKEGTWHSIVCSQRRSNLVCSGKCLRRNDRLDPGSFSGCYARCAAQGRCSAAPVCNQDQFWNRSIALLTQLQRWMPREAGTLNHALSVSVQPEDFRIRSWNWGQMSCHSQASAMLQPADSARPAVSSRARLRHISWSFWARVLLEHSPVATILAACDQTASASLCSSVGRAGHCATACRRA